MRVDRLRSTSATLISMDTGTEKNHSLEDINRIQNRTKQKETTLQTNKKVPLGRSKIVFRARQGHR